MARELGGSSISILLDQEKCYEMVPFSCLWQEALSLISRLRMLDGFAELWPTSSDQRARELLPPGADETWHFGWMPVGDHVDESSVLQNTNPAGPATFLGFLWGLGRRLVHPLAHSWLSHGG